MRKILFFLGFIFLNNLSVFAQSATGTAAYMASTWQSKPKTSTEIEQVAKEAPLQTKLDAIYANVRDYSKNDITIGQKGYCFGKIIRNRCLVVFCALMILGLGIKILPVMYSPDKELDSLFWVKPVLLAGFLGLYPQIMGMVEGLMRYLSFKDYAEIQMAVTKQVATCNNIYNYVDNASVSSTEFYSTPDMASHGSLQAQVEFAQEQIAKQKEDMEIQQAIDSNNKMSKEKIEALQKAAAKAQAQLDNESFGVKIVHDIVVWICEKISSIVRIFQTVLLSILFLGGPIAICLEAIPTFKGSLKKWFGMYVHTHLFTPVMYVIDAVTLKLYICQLDGGMGAFLAIIFQISMLVMYIMVGKCVSYFVSAEGAGMGDLAKGLAKPVAGAAAAGGIAVGFAKKKFSK